MASACLNNISMSPEKFLGRQLAKYSPYGWLSPRMSISRELADEEEASKVAGGGEASYQPSTAEEKDPEAASSKDTIDFEFRLEDPVTMLPADELFSDGKLVPLHLSAVRREVEQSEKLPVISETKSADATPRRNESSVTDPSMFSPKAPSCSIRWKELLALKKLYSNSNGKNCQNQDNRTSSSSSSASGSKDSKSNKEMRGHDRESSSSSTNVVGSLKYKTEKLSKSCEASRKATKSHKFSSAKHDDHNRETSKSLRSTFLQRSSKASTSNASLTLPLLKDIENDIVSISSSSSRLSLSSSSSGHDHEDFPRLSLDTDKPLSRISTNQNHPRLSIVKHRSSSSSENVTAIGFGVSVDSPRMNSSGKIVFHSLERSSSSPSSYGGPRYKHRGAMERSKSANVVRVTPVLNVPVCSLRGSSSKSGSVFGFPIFSSSSSSSQPKKEAHQQHTNNKNRT